VNNLAPVFAYLELRIGVAGETRLVGFVVVGFGRRRCCAVGRFGVGVGLCGSRVGALFFGGLFAASRILALETAIVLTFLLGCCLFVLEEFLFWPRRFQETFGNRTALAKPFKFPFPWRL